MKTGRAGPSDRLAIAGIFPRAQLARHMQHYYCQTHGESLVPRPAGAVAVLGFTLFKQLEDRDMLRLALVFLVIALIAAFLGFGLVAGLAFEAAKILFFIFLVLAVLAFIGGNLRSPTV